MPRHLFFFSLRPIIPVVFALFVTACAGPQTSEENAPAEVGRAATSLLARADIHVQAGQWEQAAALLERALRIEPRNAWLWHHLATLRFRQGRYAQAVSLANKSSSLVPGNTALQEKNRRLIEEARQAAERG
ncbi:MAG TPA: tetratricopeptide repeat protein [Gammaproteobacteria bacterium]|nr:tetratricopeptide repeat protein [Gammaproteobacteria bacterium]